MRILFLASALLATGSMILVSVASAKTQLAAPKAVAATYLEETDVVVATWKKVKKAKQYEVQVLQAETEERITMKKTKKLKLTLAGSLFENDTDYTIRVRALGGKKVAQSKWASTSYTHSVSEATDPPTLTTQLENTEVDGTNLWLFLVDDGESQLAASAELGGKVVMGRVNPSDTNTFNANSWTTVLSSLDTGGPSIADHWHIFAHGAHWIAASTNTASKSVLAKVSTDFTVEKVVTITDGGKTPTNDMFLVEEPDGVAVGHFLPGTGHRLFRFDTSGTAVDTVDIGGGDYVHSNGASAMAVDGGFVVLAPTTLQPSAESAIKLMRFNEDWEEESVTTLISEAGNNIAMASGVYWNEYLLVNARVITDAASHAGSGDDSGAIVRYVFNAELTQLSREEILSAGGNRPHTTLTGTTLITSWDSESTGSLRVDQVE